MNKDLFLEQLERLLYEIPKEERDEAMDYYRSYFDDAGVENEAIVLEELESPKIIADSIKEALNSTGDMTGALKNPPQVRDGQTSGKYGYGKNQSGRGYKSIFSGSDFRKKEEQTSSSDKYTQSEGANRYQSQGGADYRKYDQYERRSGQNDGRADRRTRLSVCIIFLCSVYLPGLGNSIVRSAWDCRHFTCSYCGAWHLFDWWGNWRYCLYGCGYSKIVLIVFRERAVYTWNWYAFDCGKRT